MSINDTDKRALIQAAGLRPAHVTVHGYAPACEGEPELLTGTYDAAVKPAFLKVIRTDRFAALAQLSALPGPVAATEMERERLNAVIDDLGPGQAKVIQMLRGRGKTPHPVPVPIPDAGEVEVPYAPPLPPADPDGPELSEWVD